MTDRENGKDSLLDPSILERTRSMLADGLSEGGMSGDREAFLDAMQILQGGDLEEAAEAFREAIRESDPPFDALSTVALAQCHEVRGKSGMAIRQWRDIAEDDSAPYAARYVAWMSLARAAEQRDDEALLTRAREALDKLEEASED